MSEEQPGGFYIVSDDAYMALTSSKLTLQGIYGGDIVIPEDGSQVNQLVFFCHIFWPAKCPLEGISVSIHLPKVGIPFKVDLPETPQLEMLERPMRNVRFPFPVIAPVLNTGKIEVVVKHSKGEFLLHPTWIISAAENQQKVQKTTNVSISGPRLS